MAFWNDLSDTLEPLRQNRWYLDFTPFGTGLTSLVYALKSINKPEYELTTTEHTLLTHTFRLPGLLKWKPVTLVMICTTNDQKQFVDKVIMDINQNYRTPDVGHQTISKFDFQTPLEIKEINEDGEVVQTWQLYNPLITSAKFGDLDYESENFVNVTLTISYDYAKVAAGSVKTTKERAAEEEEARKAKLATETTAVPAQQ